MRKYYLSPRWSNEILDCSMPMTFDTYNACSYNCLYCFSYFQKSHSLGKGGSYSGHHSDYQAQAVQWVNIDKVKRIFLLQEAKSQFAPYIRARKIFQWGGLSDPFDEHERKHGITLELLKFFKSINYPICFSTKGIWFTEDDRYVKVIKGCKNWNFKFSIINLDARKSSKIELGVPSPEERLKAMDRIRKLGIGGVTLRLRPFILGMTDVNGEYLDLIRKAKECGATAVSTEFFCLERRADRHLLRRYDLMSQALGYDIYKFYKRGSLGSGYSRLNRKVKAPFMYKMAELCKRIGLRFYVSDSHFKELCNNASCCGLAETWNYSRGQFTQALLIAKQKGKVSFSDIAEEVNQLHSAYPWKSAEGYNTAGTVSRQRAGDITMAEYIRNIWNTPNSLKSPYKYFGGVLIPSGVDSHGDVIYQYKEWRGGGTCQKS